MGLVQKQFIIEDASSNGTKAYTPNADQRSVVDTPTLRENAMPSAPFIMRFAALADTIPPWGADVLLRDIELRNFWVTEPLLASAVYSTSIRNASFDWEIVNTVAADPPHRNTIAAVTRMLKDSDRGGGWEKFFIKLCIDLYTTDNGGFVEVIRAADRPDAPVWNLAHLDSLRCTRTGNPETPVIYQDRKGRYHELKWYQVLTLEEFPSAIETLYGVQLCAVSRALRAAQIIRDIAIYKHEKVSGRFAGSIHIVSGISNTEIEDIKAQHEENMDNKGLFRYSTPIIFSGIDPTHPVSHEQIDLASLPDSFDEESTLRWYIAQLALAFGVDYQEFAPLPSKAMGSSAESEILHMKTRGKGPATIMKLIEHLLNNSGVLPATVKFRFKVQDLRAENEKSQARFNRGKDRALRLKNGELDNEAARQMAILDGDLPEHLAEEIRQRELEKPPPPDLTGPELGGESFTAQQIESGSTSHDMRKGSDIDRAARIHELVQQGDLPGVEPVTITEEEMQQQRQELLRRLGQQ